jgi:hypothetical protein
MWLLVTGLSQTSEAKRQQLLEPPARMIWRFALGFQRA